MASYAVAMGSRFYFRWVPWELNHADGGSRRWEQLRIEEEAINKDAGLRLSEELITHDSAQATILGARLQLPKGNISFENGVKWPC
eukprot:2243758-Karenia_brevis.AAC.1